jgi:hypothetical protein
VRLDPFPTYAKLLSHTNGWRTAGTNSLESLKRRPSDLRRYLAWSHSTKQEYGSITNFVVQKRLLWIPTPTPSGTTAPIQPSFPHESTTPFAHEDDYAVLKNDWPYGLADGIHHLLVWTKTPIAVDMSRGGDVTPESRAIIEDFVRRFFAADVGAENVLWFKNWVALQSVRGVDHVHVMVRDVSPAILEKWCTRKDIQS